MAECQTVYCVEKFQHSILLLSRLLDIFRHYDVRSTHLAWFVGGATNAVRFLFHILQKLFQM